MTLSLSFEILLIIGILGFYLYDSAMMLYSNELIFASDKNHWRYRSADGHWQMLSRNLYLPHPLRPGRALFRVCWHSTGAQANLANDAPGESSNLPDLAPAELIQSLRPLQYMTTGLLASMLVGFPVVLIVFATGLELLVLMATSYIIIIAMLIYVYRKRTSLQLTTSSFLKLAFDALVCPPFALNTTRKITLNYPLTHDAIAFAKQHFDATTFSAMIDTICQRVDTAIAYEDEGSTKVKGLLEYRNRLVSLKA